MLCDEADETAAAVRRDRDERRLRELVLGAYNGGIEKVERCAGRRPRYRVELSTSSFCSYDDEGNLFVNGYRYKANTKSGVEELQKGADKFKQVSFGASGPFFGNQPGPVQWDGRHLALGLGATILQFDIDHFRATQKGETNFDMLHQVANAWIQGGRIVVLNIGGDGSYPALQIDTYPAGGSPIKTMSDGEFGVTVSLAPQK